MKVSMATAVFLGSVFLTSFVLTALAYREGDQVIAFWSGTVACVSLIMLGTIFTNRSVEELE